MKVLILEDDPRRSAQFVNNLVGCTIKLTAKPKVAIAALQEEEWDYLFLDHDLEGEVYQESGPGTGYEVARWLEDNPERKPKNIIIHSFSSVGAQNMKRALPEAIIAPGCWVELRGKDLRE